MVTAGGDTKAAGKKLHASSTAGATGSKPRRANEHNKGGARKHGKKVNKPASTTATVGEKKPKKKQPRKKKKAAVKVDRTRDFAGDLETYLEEWAARDREGSAWKFNKVLQAWALDNCFSKKRIGSALFKQLLPYILTVQGGAMDRLVSRAAAIMSTDKSDIIDDTAEESAQPNGASNDDEAQGEQTTAEGDDGEEGSSSGKKQIVTKSMVSRAKKVQKALNA